MLMQVINPFHDFPHNYRSSLLRKGLVGLEKLEEVAVAGQLQQQVDALLVRKEIVESD